jgi:murein DD-endopeptidase MepM/ murein hydrolase activator NlpD
MRRSFLLLLVLAALTASQAQAGVGDPGVAALQIALMARGLYEGPADGALGPETVGAVKKLQKRARIAVDGVPGPQTRAALGKLGEPTLGSRAMGPGNKGWDVAELQYLLAWHGFPSGPFDGDFGPRTKVAVLRFQAWAGLPVVGWAGSGTLTALDSPPATCPIPLSWPLAFRYSDPFGPRGTRFHAGIDIPASVGTLVGAADPGRVVYAGWRDGGWGIEVTIAHRSGVRTMYAHLSRVLVSIGQRVKTGQTIGRVGATGDATGPHLHFEVRLRGAAVDPLTGLSPLSAAE